MDDEMQEDVFDDYLWDREDAEAHEVREDYCDLCEREGHTFSSCPRRDDE
jgi:hypothetical protein